MVQRLIFESVQLYTYVFQWAPFVLSVLGMHITHNQRNHYTQNQFVFNHSLSNTKGKNQIICVLKKYKFLKIKAEGMR